LVLSPLLPFSPFPKDWNPSPASMSVFPWVLLSQIAIAEPWLAKAGRGKPGLARGMGGG
jgi:hypothetical protein